MSILSSSTKVQHQKTFIYTAQNFSDPKLREGPYPYSLQMRMQYPKEAFQKIYRRAMSDSKT